jgi:hypothetical protein
VAAWRRKALEAFPDLRRELTDKDEIFSIGAPWFELLPMAKHAHEHGDQDLLERIYDLTFWCHRQRDLENAVAVGFYEHLLGVMPGVVARRAGAASRRRRRGRLGPLGVEHATGEAREGAPNPPPAEAAGSLSVEMNRSKFSWAAACVPARAALAAITVTAAVAAGVALAGTSHKAAPACGVERWKGEDVDRYGNQPGCS